MPLRESESHKNQTTMKSTMIVKAIAAAVLLGGFASTASALTAPEASAILFMKQ